MTNIKATQIHPIRAQQLIIKGYVSEQSEEYRKAYETAKGYARRIISRGGEAASAALISTGIDFILGEPDDQGMGSPE